MQSQGGDPRPSSGDGSLLKTQTVSTACPADPRSTDSLFTLRSLLETLTHRDKSLPALPPVSCKRRLPKASRKTLVSEKEKRKKKAHENASRPCPLSSIASGPVCTSLPCRLVTLQQGQHLGVCHQSQGPEQPSASRRENCGRLLPFLSSFSYLLRVFI